MIQIDQLSVEYQTRVMNPDASWLSRIFRSQYRANPVLKDLDLRMEQPGITAILGKNGAGKTTLIKTMTGILSASRGQVSVLGFDPSKRPRALYRQIAVVFGQKKMLWPELSLLENFKLTEALYDLDSSQSSDRMQTLIRLFQLESIMHRPFKSYSLGESMKAEVANALFIQPKILFLDEPTIGLDYPAQRVMRAALADYVKQNPTQVVLTSHNIDDITHLANRVYFLEQGAITEFSIHADAATYRAQLEDRLMSL